MLWEGRPVVSRRSAVFSQSHAEAVVWLELDLRGLRSECHLPFTLSKGLQDIYPGVKLPCRVRNRVFQGCRSPIGLTLNPKLTWRFFVCRCPQQENLHLQSHHFWNTGITNP